MPTNNRRDFLKKTGTAATAAALAGTWTDWASANQEDAAKAVDANSAETVVKLLYESFNDQQKSAVCFNWEHEDPKRGLLRTRVQNNWNITKPDVKSDFFTGDQQKMIRDIFEGIFRPEWHEKIDKQLKDDAGGFGIDQSIGIFGKPGDGKFEFVMTGRHMTIRCDGNSTEHMAFGGPIFYGHAADGFNESPDHKGNVFWPQAVEANKVFEMLSGKQRKLAQVVKRPREQSVQFKGPEGKFSGIPVSELAKDQQKQVQKTLRKLIEPYRQSDQEEVTKCLKAQGGLEKCHLTFYTGQDIGDDKVWDDWRLEGPSFVWHFRGSPHVHVWVNVADDPNVKANVS